MDMNFPHNDLNKATENNKCDIRILLSLATTRQVASPTYRAISQLAERSPAERIGGADMIREHIRYFTGAIKKAPSTAFLPAAKSAAVDRVGAGHISKYPVYHAASANSKLGDANMGHAGAQNGNNRGQA